MLISTLATVATATAVAAPQKRLIIDTHLEVWTLDPKFPFNHPDRELMLGKNALGIWKFPPAS